MARKLLCRFEPFSFSFLVLMVYLILFLFYSELILIGAFKWCGNFNWYCWTHCSFCCPGCAPCKVNRSLAIYVCPHLLIGDTCLTSFFCKTNLSRYFTGHSKNPDGSRQFIAGQTKVGRAVDGAIKIVTIAVCTSKCLEDWLMDGDDMITHLKT